MMAPIAPLLIFGPLFVITVVFMCIGMSNIEPADEWESWDV